MIGILVVTHGGLADELVRAAGEIAGESEALASVGLGWSEPGEAARDRIGEAIAGVDRGAGVLILTDMFGGTPSNLAISIMEHARIEVLAGVNLPMLVKLASVRNRPIAEAVRMAQEAGRKYITVASRILAKEAS